MRIARIDLRAWGHFSGRRLDLPGNQGLQLICGANEAGKSTLRRALSGALFGIPMRCNDAHRHDYAALRIGLLLEAADGQTLALMRRKGQQNTLRGYDPDSGRETDERLPDAVLSAWLGGLTDEHFTQRFSLDHDALLRGGLALAAGQGDAGETLFQAGSGLTSIHKLRSQLQAEADALFRPRARSTQIMLTRKALDEAEQRARDHSIRPQAWLAAAAERERCRSALAQQLQQQQHSQADIQRLQRLAGAFPDLALRQQLTLELNELSERLPANALQGWTPGQRETRLTAQTQREAAQRQLRLIEARRLQRNVSLTAHQPGATDAALLAHAVTIEALHHQSAAQHDLQQTLQAATQSLERAAAELGRCEDALPAALRLPDPVQLARLRRLAQAHIAHNEQQAACSRSLHQARQDITQLKAKVAALPLPATDSPLRQPDFVSRLAAAGNPEIDATRLRERLPALEQGLAQQLATLQLQDLAALRAVTLPLDGELERTINDEAQLAREHDALKRQQQACADDIAELTLQLQQMSLRGQVPSRASLEYSRLQREQLWQQIRPDAQPTPAIAIAITLCPQYERAVLAADQLADTLYQEAERATRHAELSTRLSQRQHAQTSLEAQELAWAEAAQQHQARWQALCHRHHWPLLPPTAAREWRQLFQTARIRADEIEQTRTEVGVCLEQARSLRARLAAALPALLAPENAELSLAQWQQQVQRAAQAASEQLQQQHWLNQQLQDKIADCQQHEGEAARLASQQQGWQGDWQTALAQIGLEADATAAEMEVRLAQCDALRSARAAHDRARQQWQHAKARHQAYPDALAALRLQLGESRLNVGQAWRDDPSSAGGPSAIDAATPASGELSAASEVEALWQGLLAARQRASQRQHLAAQLEEDELAASQARSELEAAEATLAALLAAAACPDLASLEQYEADAARHQQLQGLRCAAEQRLVQQCAQTLEALLQEMAGLRLEEIEAGLEAARSALKECNDAVIAAATAVTDAERGLAAIDGSTAAAQSQQAATNLRARLETQVTSYRSTRLASAILEQVIAHYQQRHQDPLLARASTYYARMTGGRFARIVVDLDESQQVLLAERASGERLLVTALSTGRRDQLYLALRLAAMAGDNAERASRGAEPLPLVFDDILIQFDDEAAAATFGILAELTTPAGPDASGVVPQILYLTHHPHLLEVARSAITNDALAVHAL